MSKPDHGAIEWSPVEWEGVYRNIRIKVRKDLRHQTWSWEARDGDKLTFKGGYGDVSTAQRAAANWFIDWQKEQAQK